MQPAPAFALSARRWLLNSETAAHYHEHLVPVLLQGWAVRLVEAADLLPNCRVLDLACGTGLAARIAAERIGARGEVVGVDPSDAVLQLARRLDRRSGAPIRWCPGAAEDLPLPAASFDAVLCHQGFQFFDDRVAASSEIARVLRPGGRLAATVWCGPHRDPLAAATIAALQNGVRPELSPAAGRPYSVRDARLLTDPLVGAGLRVISVKTSEMRVRAPEAEIFIRGVLRALPFAEEISAEHMESLVRQILAALRPHIHLGELDAPCCAWTIVAERPVEG